MKEEVKITKEEHLWTSDEKIKFMGYGEWVEELDLIEFEYLGYEACVYRILKIEPYAKEETYFGGHFCGYVKIPETHPLFRKKKECFDADLECHGGITFNEYHEEHWIGFDCGHLGDYVPTMEYMKKTNPIIKKLDQAFPIPEEFSLFNPVYRNIEYVMQSCTDLIDSLINLSKIEAVRKNRTDQIEHKL